MRYKLQTLTNGLQIISIPISGIKSATVLIMVGAGSRYEKNKINGISHFLEHMAFKGTSRRPSALEISSIIDGIGGEFNAFTGKDHTGYYIKASLENTPLLIDVLSDMLLNSTFNEKEIEKEKRVIIEEINMYEDTPMRKVADLYENLLYGDTPLGRDISGKKEVIKELARKDFISYINKYYSPMNTIITIAGGISQQLWIKDQKSEDKSKIKNLVQRHLGSWKQKKVASPKTVNDAQKSPMVLLKHKDTQQAHLVLGVRAYNLTHPSRYELSVLTTILGGGMSSRLFIQVRERRGLAYYIRSSTQRYQDVGNFATQAGIDVSRIDDAIKVIIEEYEKIRTELVSEEELEKAKKYIKGRLTLGLEDSKIVASLFTVSQLLEKKIRTPEEIARKIDRVTAKGVREVAQDIFKQDILNLAIIGPYKREERFRKLLIL